MPQKTRKAPSFRNHSPYIAPPNLKPSPPKVPFNQACVELIWGGSLAATARLLTKAKKTAARAAETPTRRRIRSFLPQLALGRFFELWALKGLWACLHVYRYMYVFMHIRGQEGITVVPLGNFHVLSGPSFAGIK